MPVFDMDVLLGFTRERPVTQYLIIGDGEQAVGITLSARPERVRLSSDQRMTHNPPLPELMQAHVGHCYRSQRVWVEWDFEALFQAAGERMQRS